ncbi:hypothetical protein BerOc1_03426 [Pseudodesulfovibrio hydrargyri]|uniref:Uncharacterized protein n=1 Tax=Pseudodesulfovibrio hydrargyri TaxID=2125990 RepID=A0A1J5NIH3_9BACT|nr:hypothetical protein [Pseudodesulfovibrio hydrargyri]OIQ51473.1 hypothetical protein BerOc1_03426 [Pseudodesulfovibrio hydrargyri]
MRRILFITVTLCLLTLSAPAWAGPGNHRIPPGQARHMVMPRTMVHGPGWGHRNVHRHAQWAPRPGHRYGQRFHHHRARHVAGRRVPVRRPVMVKERYTNRGSVQEYTIRIRTIN